MKERDQLNLFEQQPAAPLPDPLPHFDGATYDEQLDYGRLGAQMKRVFDVMKTRRWLTLAEIQTLTGDPQASISARLRDLRKEKFGEHSLERRRRGQGRAGLFEYRLTINEEQR